MSILELQHVEKIYGEKANQVNALRDISRKHPVLVAEELNGWNLSSKKAQQVHELAGKYIH